MIVEFIMLRKAQGVVVNLEAFSHYFYISHTYGTKEGKVYI